MVSTTSPPFSTGTAFSNTAGPPQRATAHSTAWPRRKPTQPLARLWLERDRDRRPRLPGILAAFAAAKSHRGQPTIIVARTVKGKGISYMENDFNWHSKPVTDQDLKQAQDELAAQEAAL